MNDAEWLAQCFEDDRGHLRAVAYRMLGSASEADDAVQEAWLRLHRSDTTDVTNLTGWLTTVVARVSLDMLRARSSRREDPLEAVAEQAVDADPAHEAVLADAVGPALLVVLETLAPAQRLAFVLHDMFAVSFDEIAPIVGRSPVAARQLASRARRRVRGVAPTGEIDRARQRAIVEAFLAAARNGEFDALVAMLDPDVVVRADGAAVQAGADAEVHGAQAVATTFSGRARVARAVLIDGLAGAVWTQGATPRVVFEFAFVGDTIIGIDLVADRDVLQSMELTALD